MLVTVSVGVLKSETIQFIPEWSETKKTAIDSVSFLPGVKMFLKFSDQFYPDVAMYCSVETGEKTFYDIAFKKTQKIQCSACW